MKFTPRLTLRTLLLICPILGAGLGIHLRNRNPVLRLEAAGAEMFDARQFGWDGKYGDMWAISNARSDLLEEIVAVELSSDKAIDSSVIDAVLSLPKIKVFAFGDNENVDANAFVELRHSKTLELVSFASPVIGDRELMALAEIPSLKTVDLFQSGATDKGIARFKQQRPDVYVQNWYH